MIFFLVIAFVEHLYKSHQMNPCSRGRCAIDSGHCYCTLERLPHQGCSACAACYFVFLLRQHLYLWEQYKGSWYTALALLRFSLCLSGKKILYFSIGSLKVGFKQSEVEEYILEMALHQCFTEISVFVHSFPRRNSFKEWQHFYIFS